MKKEPQKMMIADIIDTQKWSDVIRRFIDVLKINIFVLSPDGKPLITPNRDRRGWDLIVNTPLGDNIFKAHSIQLKKFEKHGRYLEYPCPSGLHNFAIPIKNDQSKIIAYVFVGPVLLNKRRSNSEYEHIAKEFNLNAKKMIDSMNEIRMVSFIDMKSILDLLDEVSHYATQLSLLRAKDKAIQKAKPSDELFESLLEMALRITKTECGSIMLIDEGKRELTIKLSRGVGEDITQNTHVKMGEGIAGLAASEQESYLIHGTKTNNNRIKSYLKRPDIKHALVTPLKVNDRVIGVLSLHTKSTETDLDNEDLKTVQMLSRLTSSSIKIS